MRIVSLSWLSRRLTQNLHNLQLNKQAQHALRDAWGFPALVRLKMRSFER